jgi:hypothetical protein
MFRPAALQRISSPEQLDRVVRVTLPRQWLALAALIVVVTVGVVWSAVATVPSLLSGPGYLLPREGLEPIAAPAAGTLTRFSAVTGQTVSAGQLVGEVRTATGSSVPLVSGFSGLVTEVDDAAGDFAGAGQRLALIEPVGQPLVVYAYIPIREAHALPPGLPVRVTFEAGIGATYGYARARVVNVSRYAASEDRLSWILQNSAQVRTVEQLGPVDEIEVRLTPSPHTPSGWVWASGSGPPGQLPPGVSASVQFVVGSHHPISDVL